MKMEMNKFLVSFLAIASILLLAVAGTVSAYTVSDELANVTDIQVNGISVYTSSGNISVIAGETIVVKVSFDSIVVDHASNVRLGVEIEGEKADVESRTDYFDVEEGITYVKTLTLKVPYELSDDVSRDLRLNVKIWNADYKSEVENIVLRVQRPSYNLEILSVTTDRAVNAGELFPVVVVLKNVGYNNLDDLFVTVRIPGLGVEKSSYFGDLVNVETSDDDVDTVKGTLYLEVPYDSKAGKYALEVEVSGDDLVTSKVKEITVLNEFPETVMKTDDGLFFINPTNTLKVYRVILPSGGEEIVSVLAGSSKTLGIKATSENYVVSVLTMNGEVVGSFTFGSESSGVEGPVVALTVILAIIFVVLLIILVILVTKKPEKTEELGESYY